jgi:Subtilase family
MITIRPALSMFVLLACIALAAQQSNAPSQQNAAQSQKTTQLAPKTVEQLQAIEKDKAQQTVIEKKLSTQLRYTVRASKGQKPVEGAPYLTSTVAAQPETLLKVTVKGTISEELQTFVKAQGGVDIKAVPKYNIMSLRLPANKVETVAARPEIKSMEFSAKALLNQLTSGPQDPEGDAAHDAAAARARFNPTGGAGVKVCVISDSVDNLANAQSKGSLGDVQVLPGAAGSGSGEGTAMLEIVHRIAPGASLAFATGDPTDVGMALNIFFLKGTGCNIIVDDLTYMNESPFQDGPIARAVQEVSDSGILYFSSAANSGNQMHGTSGTWEGDFNPSNRTFSVSLAGPNGTTTTTTFVAHQFAPNVIFDTITNIDSVDADSKYATLFWNDPLGSQSNNYEIAILDQNDNVTSISNTGSADPYEEVQYDLNSRVAIFKKTTDQNRFIHLATNRAQLAIGTSGATQGHNASGAANVFTVAAISAENRTTAFVGGITVHAEDFSSDGPRRIFYRPDGTPFTPGNFTHTGGQLLNKPDITAADCITTDVPVQGLSFFCGTSAAAPHAAAIAALIKSAFPSLSPAQIRSALTSTALDIETPGWDDVSGIGIVMPGPSLASARAMSADPFVSFENKSVATQSAAFTPESLMSYNGAPRNVGWVPNTPGSFNVTFNSTAANTPLTLVLYHSTSPLWPGPGNAPVDIKLNDVPIVSGYDVASHHNHSLFYEWDRLPIPATAVLAGTNTLTFNKVPGNFTNYWIRSCISATP